MRKLILFAIPAFIWGSTWLAIKFQLGVVDPLISIFYRFLFAALVLFVYAYFARLNLKFSLRQHFFMALQGTLLFSINYWLVYLAEQHLTSGLVAIVFSTIIFLNIFNGALLLKSKINLRVVTGAVLGFLGVALVFKDEVVGFNFSSGNSIAFLLALIGAVTASLGNIASAYNQRNQIPVLQTNAFGMLYGSLLMLILAGLLGKPMQFDFSFLYISSLLYLAIFGSVIAFGSYLKLLGEIGADKAAYVTLIIPIIALILSTLFEGYQWNSIAFLGVALIILGNIFVLKKKQ